MLQPSRGIPGNSIKTPPPACRSKSPACLKEFRSPSPIRCPPPYREPLSPWQKGLKPNCRPRDGDRTITYEFAPQVASNRRVEAFQLDYTVEMDTPEDESTDDSPPPQREPVVGEPTAVFLQATLAPGESERCNGGLCVPRYRTEFVPPEDELPLPEFDAYFPINPRFRTPKFSSQTGEIWT